MHDSQRKCQTVCCFFLSQSSIGLLQREPKPQRSKEQKQVNIRASLLHPSIPFPSPQLQVRATRFPLPCASICSLSPLPSHRGCRFHLPKTSLPFAASLLCSRIPRPLPSSPGRPWPGTILPSLCLTVAFSFASHLSPSTASPWPSVLSPKLQPTLQRVFALQGTQPEPSQKSHQWSFE